MALPFEKTLAPPLLFEELRIDMKPVFGFTLWDKFDPTGIYTWFPKTNSYKCLNSETGEEWTLQERGQLYLI